MANAIQDLVVSTAMDTHTAQVEALRAKELSIKSLTDILLELDNCVNESRQVLKEARNGVEVPAFNEDGTPMMGDDGNQVIVVEGKNPELALKGVKSIVDTLKVYFDLFREHREQEDHEVENLKAEQETVLRIIQEVVAPHPEIADELARRFEEEGLV